MPMDAMVTAVIETSLNQLLALDKQSPARLRKLAGKVLKLELRELKPLWFVFSERRLDVLARYEGEPDAVLCLLANDEFAHYGVEDLMTAYAAAGLSALHQPIVDGRVPTHDELHRALDFVDGELGASRNVLIHCVGGLGRAGTLALRGGMPWLRA